MKKVAIVMGQELILVESMDGVFVNLQDLLDILNYTAESAEQYAKGNDRMPAYITELSGMKFTREFEGTDDENVYINVNAVPAVISELEGMCAQESSKYLISQLAPIAHTVFGYKVPGVKYRTEPQLPLVDAQEMLPPAHVEDLFMSLGFTAAQCRMIMDEYDMQAGLFDAISVACSFNLSGASGSALLDMLDFISDCEVAIFVKPYIECELDYVIGEILGKELNMDDLLDMINQVVSTAFSQYIGE